METGWNHNGFRDYMPQLGRYLEPDPLGRLGSGNNFYVYVYDNPVNLIDPLGLCPLSHGCQLVAPGGNYHVGPNAVALFQAPMANALTNAFDALNSQGITPTINSGYRSPSNQALMQNGGSGPNPAALISRHEVGMAVDINGTTSGFFPAIISAMQARGLTWGGTFTHRDPSTFNYLAPYESYGSDGKRL